MLVRWRCLLLTLILVGVAYATSRTPKHVNRLSGDQIPIRYELLLRVPVRGFVSDFAYKTDGRVTIQFENKKDDADSIELHSLFHTINHVTLRRFDTHDDTIRVLGVEPHRARQTIQLKVENLPIGIYELELHYHGVISTDSLGLYETAYMDKNLKWRYALSTQGEPVHIRRIVPCFDEPSMRATWQVTLVHPKGTQALSNSKSIHEQEYEADPRYIRTTFDDTPPMSSYLLALVISDFSVIRSPSKTGTTVGIVYPNGHNLNPVHDSLNFSKFAVDVLAETFRVPYTLTKIDHIAVPDFDAGAMENWGLVTYREHLLTRPGRDDEHWGTIAHETTHQWFGNLVTAKWWSDLWLHEGFASLYEHLPVASVLNMSFDDAALVEFHETLSADRWRSYRPMHDESLDSPTEISTHFNFVSYGKASLVVNMFRHLLGEEKWYAGLQRYLLDRQFKNANAEDFFNLVAGEYSALFRSFTHQNGFPIVHVRRTPSGVALRASKYNVLRFEQDELPSTFIVPVFYRINASTINTIIIHGEDEVAIPLGQHDVLHVDPHAMGYYVVLYEDMNSLQTLLDESLENVRILDDVHMLTADGYMDAGSFLSLTVNPIRLRNYLNGFRPSFEATHLAEEFETLLHQAVSLSFKSIDKASWKHVSSYKEGGGVVGERSRIHSAMRMLLPSDAGSFNRAADVQEAKEAPDRIPLSPAAAKKLQLRCEVLSTGGGNFENQMRMLDEAKTKAEYDEIKFALSKCRLSAADSRRLLMAYLNETNYHFRYQDVSAHIEMLGYDAAANSIFIDVLFDEILPNYENRYQYNIGLVETFMNSFHFDDEHHVNKLNELCDQYPKVYQDYSNIVKQTLEQAYHRKAWTKKVGPKILDALRAYVKRKSVSKN